MLKASFLQWMKQIDNYLLRKVSLTSREFPDQNYMDMFLDGLTPFEVGRKILEREGYYALNSSSTSA